MLKAWAPQLFTAAIMLAGLYSSHTKLAARFEDFKNHTETELDKKVDDEVCKTRHHAYRSNR